MDFQKCKLYKIERKRDLSKALGVDVRKLRDVINTYKPYIKNGKKSRLIEPTYNKKLKYLQKVIHAYLLELDYDENIFGGVKNKSYLENGKYHLNGKYVVALDIKKFFPNVSREKIYRFYNEKLKCSKDVSEILSDICSINLEYMNCKNVYEYLKDNGIKNVKHLPTGAAFSSILAYLSNIDMFDEISELCTKNNCRVSYYVDDIVVSSESRIKRKFINKIDYIIRSNGYSLQLEKLKRYYPYQYKRVTGAIISKDAKRLVYPNRVTYKLKRIRKMKNIDEKQRNNKIRGLEQVLVQVDRKNQQ